MKYYSLLLALAGILFGLALALIGRDQLLRAGARQPVNVSSLLTSFTASQESEANVELPGWDSNVLKELVDPNKALPTSFLYPRNEMALLVAFAETCGKAPSLSDSRLRKALRWHEYLCGFRHHLPANFFQMPPFMHPGGHSFVWLAIQAHARFVNRKWIAENGRYLHLKELYGTQGISEPLRALRALPLDLLGSVLAGAPLAGNGKKWLIRQSSFVLLFPSASFEKYLQDRRFKIFPNSSRCRASLGAFCIEVDAPRFQRDLSDNLGCLIFAIAGLFLVLAILAAKARKRKLDARNARLLMLKMLTHELRTPAAGLSLTTETFRKHFDSLSMELQQSFLRLCDDVYRLNRLIRASTQYLRSQEDPNVFRFDIRSFSINELVADAIEESESQVHFTPVQDFEVATDPYWLRTCLLNLIDNSVKHGSPPIEIQVYKSKDYLTVAVRDGGRLSDEFTLDLPPAQRPSSGGLGFGLQIIQRVIGELGGYLSFESSPTKFCLNLKRCHE